MRRAYWFFLCSQRGWGPVSGAVSYLLFVRIDTDTYDDSATAMETTTATATAATTRTDISQSPSSPSLSSPPLRRHCAHFVCSPTTPALLLLLLLLRFCRRSAYSFIRLLVGSPAASYVDVLSLRASATASAAVAATGSLALAVLGQRLWAQQSEILVRMYRQAGRQRPYKQNFSKLVEFHRTLRRVCTA